MEKNQQIFVVQYPGHEAPIIEWPTLPMTLGEYEARVGSGEFGPHHIEYVSSDEPGETPTPENTLNLTPHEIVFVEGETKTSFPASGLTIRMDENSSKTPSGKFCRKSYGLPILIEVATKKPATQNIAGKSFYIVSGMALEAMKKQQKDKTFISPDTGSGAVRNEKGQIVGTKCWVLEIEE